MAMGLNAGEATAAGGAWAHYDYEVGAYVIAIYGDELEARRAQGMAGHGNVVWLPYGADLDDTIKAASAGWGFVSPDCRTKSEDSPSAAESIKRQRESRLPIALWCASRQDIAALLAVAAVARDVVAYVEERIANGDWPPSTIVHLEMKAALDALDKSA
jgi:hypothetical protein